MINGDIKNTEIDPIKTAHNVRIFFETVFPDYLIEAGYHRTDLKTHQINQNGVVSHNGLDAEGKMKHIYIMQNKCKAVYQAINSLPDKPKQPFKTILSRLYLDELENWKVAAGIGYSSSKYYDLKQKACCKFAKAIAVQKIMYNVTIPDLQVFKCESNK